MNVTRRMLVRLVPLAALVVAATLLSNAAATPSHQTRIAKPDDRSGSYGPGTFTFTTPVQMPKAPLSPAFFQADGEPEINADIYGNVYITAINGVPGGTDLWKSTNKGANWTYLGQPDGAQDHCSTPVPQCVAAGGADDSTAVSSGGYLYVSSLWIGNTTMSVSKDGGAGGAVPDQAWSVNPASGGVPVEDRQWIAAYGPQTVYMTWRQAPGTGRLVFTKSTDAGKTFSPPQLLTTADSTEGNLVVDPYNGNLYTTFIPTGAGNRIDLLRSTDGGATWVTKTGIYTGPAGTSPGRKFTILAVDRGGNLHLVFGRCTVTAGVNGDCHVYLTSSAEAGAATGDTWLPAVQVDGPAGVPNGSNVMPWVSAGSPGIVNVTFLHSANASPDNPSNWTVAFAQTRDAMSAAPTFALNQVESATMHNHDICFNGGGCGGDPDADDQNRDLLEYYTMTLDPDGNANIAYADSVNNCDPDGPDQFCITNTWFAKQTGGPGSYAPPAGPAGATFSANLTLPASNTDAEPNIWADSHGCLYAAAPGDPDTWYSEDNGATWTNVVPGVLPSGGGDEHTVGIPKANGSRDDPIYLADLALADVSIRKSTDRGHTWFSPGTAGAAGELDASSDRQWLAGDRVNSGADQVLYEMDHELASELIRFSASVNDSAWSPPASGMTDPELPSTIPNTNPGPVFVDPATHKVYGFFTAATPTTNAMNPPFGKMPNVWEAVGPGATAAGSPPGPMVNHAAFRGVFDSPTTTPAAAQTFGVTTANDFPSAAIDAGGNVYAVWAMNNARTNQFGVWFASSHDHGESFYGPFQIGSGPGSAEMPWIAAGANGRIDVVYYQSDDPGNPNSTNLHWNTMFAQSLNASAREPVFTVSKASDHVMHFGPICNQGLLCASGTRVLLDFFQVSISTDGMAHIVFADTGNANSPSHVTYTRQTSGPSALLTQFPPSCLGPTAVEVSSLSAKRTAPRTVAVAWRSGTATTTLGFNVWRSKARDGRFARLNGRLIPVKSLVSASGRSYRYVDRKAPSGRAYYKLQIVGVDGRSTWAGPVAAGARRAARPQELPGAARLLLPASFAASSAARFGASPVLWLLVTSRAAPA